MWRIVVGDSARSVADADFQTVVKSMRLSDTTSWYHPGVHTPPKRCLRDVTGGCACVPMLCKVACSVWHHATLPSRAGRTRGRRPELDINRLDGSLVHTNVLVLSLHSLNHSPSKRSAMSPLPIQRRIVVGLQHGLALLVSDGCNSQQLRNLPLLLPLSGPGCPMSCHNLLAPQKHTFCETLAAVMAIPSADPEKTPPPWGFSK